MTHGHYPSLPICQYDTHPMPNHTPFEVEMSKLAFDGYRSLDKCGYSAGIWPLTAAKVF